MLRLGVFLVGCAFVAAMVGPMLPSLDPVKQELALRASPRDEEEAAWNHGTRSGHGARMESTSRANV